MNTAVTVKRFKKNGYRKQQQKQPKKKKKKKKKKKDEEEQQKQQQKSGPSPYFLGEIHLHMFVTGRS